MGSRQLAKAATRAKVLQAARVCFYAHGYADTTMRMVAEHAGMSCGAIFSSFAGKADLYRAVFGHEPITPEDGRLLLDALKAVRFAYSLAHVAQQVDPAGSESLQRASAVIARVEHIGERV